jgi:hypothetical protein
MVVSKLRRCEGHRSYALLKRIETAAFHVSDSDASRAAIEAIAARHGRLPFPLPADRVSKRQG